MNDIKIIQATKSDFDEIYDLTVKFTEFNSLATGKRDEFFYENWETDFKDEITKVFEGNNSKYFLASVDGVAAGYILCCICLQCAKYEIEELFVLSEFRSHGLGKKLLDFAVADSKKYDVPIKLEVYDWNKNAIDFYKRMGFQSDGLILKLEN